MRGRLSLGRGYVGGTQHRGVRHDPDPRGLEVREAWFVPPVKVVVTLWPIAQHDLENPATCGVRIL